MDLVGEREARSKTRGTAILSVMYESDSNLLRDSPGLLTSTSNFLVYRESHFMRTWVVYEISLRIVICDIMMQSIPFLDE